MDGFDGSVPLSSLICLEDGARLVAGDEEDKEENRSDALASWESEEMEDEYMEILLSRESRLEDGRFSPAGDWMRSARADAIRWILKMKSCFNLRLQTAYMAVTYLDRFFARRAIDKGKCWAVHLAAAACLSLAAKMEECRPPVLSELQTESYHFDCGTIQRMELLVLNTLEWRMSSVTPFSYLRHFLNKFRFEGEREHILAKAVGFLFATIEGMALVDYQPSAIAAAAVLAASDGRLTEKMVEAKMSLISLEIEKVFSCYSLIIQEESNQEKFNPSMMLPPSNSSSIISSLATRSIKRRRLELAHSQ